MENKTEYESQMKLTVLSLLGETPNYIALLISALSTRSILIFVDMLDTAGNMLRNLLVLLISGKLRKDLRFTYNYGVGKIEAVASIVCDGIMVLSLTVALCFAVRDIIWPHPAEGLILFALVVKLLNVGGDVFLLWRERKLCRASDSLVLRSSLALAVKNLAFDLSTLIALALMSVLGRYRVIWYVSPVCSLVLGVYLIINTWKRMRETAVVILDKATDEPTQMLIMQTLAQFYEKYEALENVQTRISGGTVIVDLTLGFHPEMSFAEMKGIADDIASAMGEKIPKCEVSLRIPGKTE